MWSSEGVIDRKCAPEIDESSFVEVGQLIACIKFATLRRLISSVILCNQSVRKPFPLALDPQVDLRFNFSRNSKEIGPSWTKQHQKQLKWIICQKTYSIDAVIFWLSSITYLTGSIQEMIIVSFYRALNYCSWWRAKTRSIHCSPWRSTSCTMDC